MPHEYVHVFLPNDKETCLLTKSLSGEDLPESTKFLCKTLHHAVHRIALDSNNINTRR